MKDWQYWAAAVVLCVIGLLLDDVLGVPKPVGTFFLGLSISCSIMSVWTSAETRRLRCGFVGHHTWIPAGFYASTPEQVYCACGRAHYIVKSEYDQATHQRYLVVAVPVGPGGGRRRRKREVGVHVAPGNTDLGVAVYT